jgi:eukaryotic-like serine/threonine-protein kinase
MTQTEKKSQGRRMSVRAAAANRIKSPQRLGRWELLEVGATGTWAEIHRARPVGAASDAPAAYAVKMLRPQWAADARAAAMLVREAEAGRAASHPRLVAVLETHVLSHPPYLVMPWLEGVTLQARLAEDRALELPAALWIARQTAEALDALDTAGWTHGDIKPGNIFISPQGHATLLDLGFARRRGEGQSAVDRPLQGTCNYLAPEALASTMGPDILSDIYSLGAVLFQMISGRLPYEAKDLADLAVKHRQAAAPNLRRQMPQLPGEVTDLVGQMLAKDPLRRPASPRELVRRLVALEIATFSERAA